MKTWEITVRQYMTRKSDENFDFMKKYNNDIPMPLVTMTGTIEKETKGMYYMKLHGDINSKTVNRCMKCGKVITNKISQYFGMGPDCGNHHYISPFNSQAELDKAVEQYRTTFLNRIKWEGWVIKSSIIDKTLIYDDGNDIKPIVNMIIDKANKLMNYTQVSVYISFEYNSYLVEAIKQLPFRFWLNDTKQWEIPWDRFEYIKKLCSDKGYELNIKDNRVEQPKPKTHTNYEFKTKPFQHQIEGFEFGMSHDKWLLTDEQGLGKTKQIIDIACAKKLEGLKHCLIVCGVNGLKWNWQKEIEIHSNEKGYILGQRLTRKNTLKIGSNKDKLEDVKNIPNLEEFFIITNVETLRDTSIVTELKKLCDNGIIGMLAMDEAHRCKSHNSQQGKGFLKLQPKVRIAMTGTPVMNRPLDLYVPLKWLDYETHQFYSFRLHYCYLGGFNGNEVIGYKNLDELRSKLDVIMLRRLKEDVFDLPEKLYIDEYVEMTPKQSVIYREVTSNIKAHIDEIVESNSPLSQLIRLRQATGYTGILSSEIKESAKLDRMEELVEEAIENGNKVIVFSNWTKITEPAYQRLSKYGCRVITGETKDELRQQYVEEFQNDKNVKVMIGTIGALGTGLTLTAATVEIFLDHPWTRAAYDQAVDRAHRIGQQRNVTIYNLLCKDTIDERIWSIVQNKGKMSDAIIDNKIDGDKRELIEFLLS